MAARLRQGATDLEPYWHGQIDMLEEYDAALPAFLREAANRVAATEALRSACVAMVEAEDALLADLRAEGKHPDWTERPWTLVDAMREALGRKSADTESTPGGGSTPQTLSPAPRGEEGWVLVPASRVDEEKRWSEECKAELRELEDKHDISVCSSTFAEYHYERAERLRKRCLSLMIYVALAAAPKAPGESPR